VRPVVQERLDDQSGTGGAVDAGGADLSGMAELKWRRANGAESLDHGEEAALERDAWVVLLTVPGLGPVTFAGLLAAFGSARAVLTVAAGPKGAARLQEAVSERGRGVRKDWGRDPGALPNTDVAGPDQASQTIPQPEGISAGSAPNTLGADLADRISHHVFEADRTLAIVRSLGLAVVTLDDPAYPERLRRIEMPPPMLFVRGSTAALNGPSAVAVVGTRRPTDKGRMIAGWIGSALARSGSVVVSGLAVGIDGAAHAAVVGEGMATVAMLGGGHARLFPRAHERLADAIVATGGAVVAEFPP